MLRGRECRWENKGNNRWFIFNGYCWSTINLTVSGVGLVNRGTLHASVSSAPESRLLTRVTLAKTRVRMIYREHPVPSIGDLILRKQGRLVERKFPRLFFNRCCLLTDGFGEFEGWIVWIKHFGISKFRNCLVKIIEIIKLNNAYTCLSKYYYLLDTPILQVHTSFK